MSTVPKKRYTEAEYLAFERRSETKHEFFRGELFDMVGATEPHVLIVGNAVRELGTQLKHRPCKVYSTDMRLKVSRSGLYTYPDVMVVCGEALFEDLRRDTLLDAQLIIEVLSESTEAYDRGKKFEHYRKIESFVEYVLISQDEPLVEHYVRQPDGQWLFSEVRGLEGVLRLDTIGCELKLAEIYDKVLSA